jgi:hypothetical protein
MALGAVIGTVVGVLIAGALAKVFPNTDLVIVQAAIVALSCLLGVILDGADSKRRKGKR